MIRTFRYSVPDLPDGFGGWGVFVLDSTGYFSASTDYGNYMYDFPNSFNGDFREFVAYNLCDSRDDYILRKVFREGLSGGKEYNAEKTRTGIKRHICEYRRTDNYTKEVARELWDEIGLQNDIDTEHDFDNWYQEVSHIDCEAYEHKVMDWTAQAVAFRDELLPRLKPLILAELDRERVFVWEYGKQRVEYKEAR